MSRHLAANNKNKNKRLKQTVTSAKQKYHILRRAYCALQRAATPKLWGLGLFLVLFTLSPILYTRVGGDARVYAAPSNHLNFQARLLTGSGGIAPDGNYSVTFNLYNVSSGGATQWTETQASVPVRSGYLSVYLGSVTSFPGTVDWSQQQWLTMNVNGDGEMTPRLKLTAVPNAMHANEATALRNGSSLLTASNLAQLAPSDAQVINSVVAALRLNQTGNGLLAQLQGDGSDVFTIAKNGDVVSGGSATFSGGTLTVGSTSQIAGLVLHDGAGKTGTLKTAVLGANRTYTFPNIDGTVLLDTTLNGTFYSQDGNSFSGPATLGTNDDNALAFETNGTAKMTILSNGNVGIGTSGTPGALLSIGGTTGSLTIDSSGNIVTGGTYNGNTFTSSVLTFSAASTSAVRSAVNQALTLESQGSGNLNLTAGSGVAVLGAATLQTTGSLALDLSNGSDTTLNLQNSGAGLANMSVEGSLTAGSSRFNVNTDGDITAAFRTLDGASTTSSNSGLTPPSNSLALVSAASFDVGNYVKIDSANCVSGVNSCYSKITAKVGNTLTISPALTWASGAAVTEMHIPELGGTNLARSLTSRYGRGYFIDGIVTGNGSTYYSDGLISSEATTFNLLNDNVATLNIGGGATSINLGAASSTVTIAGSLATSGTNTVTAGGGLVVSSGGASITGNSSITSGTFASSGGFVSLNASSDFGTNINTGSSSGTVTIGGGSAPLVINSTNFDVSSAGALSGITSIGLSGAITGATATNTINGLVINAGSLSSVGNITGAGALNLSSGNGTNLTLTAGSGIALLGATTVRTADSLAFDLQKETDTILNIQNSGAGLANVSIDGGLSASSGAVSGGFTLGTSSSLDGSLIFKSSGGSGTITINAPSANPSTYVLTLPSAQGGSNTTLVNNGSGGLTWGAIGCSTCLAQVPATSVQNTIAPTAAGVVGLTVKGTTGTAANVLEIFDSTATPARQAYFDASGSLNVSKLIQPGTTNTVDLGISSMAFRTGYFATSLLTASVDTISAGTLSVGTANATAISIGKAGVATNVLGTTTFEAATTVGNGTGNDYLGFSAESTNPSCSAGNYRIWANSADGKLKKCENGAITDIGTAAGGGTGTLQDGYDNSASPATITTSSAAKGILFRSGVLVDSTSLFSLQNSLGVALFVADTTNMAIKIGGGNVSPDGSPTLLILDYKNSADDPTGTNGAMYYNSSSNRMRCYEAGAWSDCVTHRNAVNLAADVINTSALANTIADVTGLSWPVIANTTYKFECTIWYTAAATGTGSRWAINGPATTALMYQSEYSLTTTTSTRNAMVAAYDSPAASNATSATTGSNMATLNGIIRPSANGTVTVRFASEVALSAITAKAGSTCDWWVN